MTPVWTIWRRGRRLTRLTFFRPPVALALFGGLTLVSNWLWFGTGLFLGAALGRALTAATTMGIAVAGIALWQRRRPLTALVLLIVAAVLLPTLALVALRLTTGAPVLMHDGAYQTEEAIKALLQGTDPYGLDYSQTSMRRWHWYVSDPPDPSLFRYVYYPLTFLLALPASAAATATRLPFDFRLVLLAVGSVAALAVLKLPWRWEWRFVLLAALFLDPLFYLPQGRNDILFLTALIVAALAWSRDRPVAAAWAFGSALAFKQFAVVFLPLTAAAVLSLRVRRAASGPQQGVALAGLVVPLLATTLPFVLWQPAAFLADTAGHVTGTVAGSYPIRGYGLSALLLALHVFPDSNASFPFGVIQAVVGVPLLLWGLMRVWRRPTLARVLHAGFVTMLAVLFCSRYLNDNHLAVLLFLAVLAGAARRGEAARAGAAASTLTRRRAA